MYRKLSRAREWEGWLNVARLIHTAQPEALETDNTFCYTGRLAPGFVDAIVQDAEPNKVGTLDSLCGSNQYCAAMQPVTLNFLKAAGTQLE